MDENKDNIDFGKIFHILWTKRKIFYIIWPSVFILSCIWIFPQPRYYQCSVSLAPEVSSENLGGGISSLASSFGINLGSSSNDAIYPELYPDLLTSNEFIIGVLGIHITTEDNTLNTDYYTYLAKHQKKNWLTKPFEDIKQSIINTFSSTPKASIGSQKRLNPFKLSEFDYNLAEIAKHRISCYVNKKTDVVTLTIEDQDPLVCATLADSVKTHLQDFIIRYRTQKARIDVEHYQQLADSAQIEYDKSIAKYADYCDRHQDILLQSSISERDKLENDMQLKYNTFTAMCTQLEAMKAKLQERTPVFTTLKSATVPIKPAGPKRMLFILAMLILTTLITVVLLTRTELQKLFAAKQ